MSFGVHDGYFVVVVVADAGAPSSSTTIAAPSGTNRLARFTASCFDVARPDHHNGYRLLRAAQPSSMLTAALDHRCCHTVARRRASSSLVPVLRRPAPPRNPFTELLRRGPVSHLRQCQLAGQVPGGGATLKLL